MQISTTDFEPLDFGDPRKPLPDNNKNTLRFAMRLLALCAWPSDQTEQRQFEASFFANMLGTVLQASHANSARVPFLQRLWVARDANKDAEPFFRSFDAAGGLLTVANSPSLDAIIEEINSRILPAWRSVGAQLATTRSIAVHHGDIGSFGASLNKARHVLNAVSQYSTTTMESDWAKFYPVAHFCAAFHVFSGHLSDFTSIRHFLTTYCPTLLATAREFEGWATSYVPHGRDEPILSPHRIWSVEHIASRWRIDCSCPALESGSLKALEEYSNWRKK